MNSPCIRIVALLLLAPLSPAAGADDEVHERRGVSPDGEVEISNTSGTIEVRAWDKSEVEVEGELGRGAERLLFETEGKRTIIKVLRERGRHGSGSDLKVRVPERSRLLASGTSVDIVVEGVRGAQRLSSISGDVRTESWTEDVELKTVSGDLVLIGHGERGIITANAVSGDIVLRNIAGELVAATVSGDLVVEGGLLSRMRLQTTNGDMLVEAELAEDGRYDFETINGDLRFTFDGPLDAEFDIESFNGDIENCFGPEARRVSRYAPGRELRFTEGTGSARVRIKSLNGDIRLCDDG